MQKGGRRCVVGVRFKSSPIENRPREKFLERKVSRRGANAARSLGHTLCGLVPLRENFVLRFPC